MLRRANEIFETILDKPESTRKKIGFIGVVFIMAIVIGIWWMTFSIEPTSGLVTGNDNTAVASPFDITWSSIKNMLKLNPIFK